MLSNRKQKQLQKENKILQEKNNQLKGYYRSLEEQVTNTRKIHHDIRKHMDILHTLINNIDKDNNIHTSFQNLSDKIEHTTSLVYVDHPVLNAIISNKSQLCKEHNIIFHVEIHNFSHAYMKDSDLVILFSNLLDNAIEECLRLDSNSKPKINLKCGKYANNIILICQNSTNKISVDTKIPIPTEKSDTFTHGLGRSIIKEMLEDYQGSFETTITNGYFQSTILLPERSTYVDNL